MHRPSCRKAGQKSDRQTDRQTDMRGLTCKELKDKHAAAHLLEDRIPDLPTALKAALADIQDVVAPHDPAEDEVDQGKGQDDRAGGRIGQDDDVDEHHDANFPPIPDAVRPQSCNLVSIRFWRS